MGQHCSRRAVRSSSCQTDDVSDNESSTWEEITPSFDLTERRISDANFSGDMGLNRTHGPPMLVIELGADQGSTTCILCDEDPTKGLFTHSWNLVGTILGTKSIAEELYIEDEDVYRQLQKAGKQWWDQNVLSLTYNGRKALGAGHNKMRCQRAARLSLAALVYTDDGNWDSVVIPDPTNDHSFETLVNRVRHTRICACSQSPSSADVLGS